MFLYCFVDFQWEKNEIKSKKQKKFEEKETNGKKDNPVLRSYGLFTITARKYCKCQIFAVALISQNLSKQLF